MTRKTELKGGPSRRPLRDESGVALVIVLTIVALLTITVVEFTYSVQLDMHRARNALDAMQAKLLARSGVDLAASFLALDQEDKYDAFTEDWAVALHEFCNGVEIEPTTRLRCDVEDESGKINVNLTKPRRTATPGGEPKPGADAYLRDALEYLMTLYEIPITELGDQVREYWETTLPTEDADRTLPAFEFSSIEEFAAKFRIPTSKLPKLRRVLTALPPQRLSKINVNTASPDVLRAVIVGYDEKGEDVVQSILQRRQEETPFENDGAVKEVLNELEEDRRAVIANVLGARSSYFRLQASALTNVDPTGVSSGGIGETLTVLISRTARNVPGGTGRAAPTSQAGATGQTGAAGGNQKVWTFRLLDWQKEAGARLFRQPRPEETAPGDETGQGDSDLLK